MTITTMGQPQIAGLLDFDVTRFMVVAEGVPEIGGVVNIVDTSETFTLRLDFSGTGTMWRNLCDDARLPFRIHFDAEGIGPWPHNEYHLGEANGALQPGRYSYDVRHTARIPTKGVYRLSAYVEFPGWEGVLGFAEGLLVHANPLEE